jgi:hypothetical protein
MKRLLLALVFAGAALMYADEPARVQKIVAVRTGDANQIYGTVREVLRNLPLNMTMYQNNIILNGTADAVAAAEQLITNLEASSPRERDIDVTGYIILASTQADGAPNMPADLDPVLKQFRNLLTYKSFRVLDTLILRLKENSRGETGGFLALPNVPPPGASEGFVIERASISGDVVHLKSLRLRVSVPTPAVAAPSNNAQPNVAFVPRDVSLSTDVDIKTGQKVAIGKASVNPAGDALILVVSAKVVD